MKREFTGPTTGRLAVERLETRWSRAIKNAMSTPRRRERPSAPFPAAAQSATLSGATAAGPPKRPRRAKRAAKRRDDPTRRRRSRGVQRAMRFSERREVPRRSSRGVQRATRFPERRGVPRRSPSGVQRATRFPERRGAPRRRPSAGGAERFVTPTREGTRRRGFKPLAPLAARREPGPSPRRETSRRRPSARLAEPARRRFSGATRIAMPEGRPELAPRRRSGPARVGASVAERSRRAPSRGYERTARFREASILRARAPSKGFGAPFRRLARATARKSARSVSATGRAAQLPGGAKATERQGATTNARGVAQDAERRFETRGVSRTLVASPGRAWNARKRASQRPSSSTGSARPFRSGATWRRDAVARSRVGASAPSCPAPSVRTAQRIATTTESRGAGPREFVARPFGAGARSARQRFTARRESAARSPALSGARGGAARRGANRALPYPGLESVVERASARRQERRVESRGESARAAPERTRDALGVERFPESVGFEGNARPAELARIEKLLKESRDALLSIAKEASGDLTLVSE